MIAKQDGKLKFGEAVVLGGHHIGQVHKASMFGADADLNSMTTSMLEEADERGLGTN